MMPLALWVLQWLVRCFWWVHMVQAHLGDMTGYQEPIEIGSEYPQKMDGNWMLKTDQILWFPNVPKTQWPVHNTHRQKDEEGLCWTVLLIAGSRFCAPIATRFVAQIWTPEGQKRKEVQAHAQEVLQVDSAKSMLTVHYISLHVITIQYISLVYIVT